MTYMWIIFFDMCVDNSTVPTQVTLIRTRIRTPIRTRTLIRTRIQIRVRVRVRILIPIRTPIRIRTATIPTGKSTVSTCFDVYMISFNFLYFFLLIITATDRQKIHSVLLFNCGRYLKYLLIDAKVLNHCNTVILISYNI